MSSNLDAIAQFIQYFRDRIPALEKVEPIFYRKILYATALDPLARAAFGAVGKHRARNLRLIDELAHWDERDRVSLPQLCLALEEKKITASTLYREVKALLNQWSPGGIIRLDVSPRLSEISAGSQPEELCVLKACSYAELFYTYRNNLVHEFREPGYGIEMPTDKNQPYYHCMLNEPWQLVFPVGFFAWLYSEALEGLEKLLMEYDIDPYCQFEFGSRWRAR